MTQINRQERNTEPAAKIEHKSYPPLSSAQRQTLEYLQSLTREMSMLAKGNRAYRIGYLLDMAYIDINEVLRGEQPISAGFVEGQFKGHVCGVPAPARRQT